MLLLLLACSAPPDDVQLPERDVAELDDPGSNPGPDEQAPPDDPPADPILGGVEAGQNVGSGSGEHTGESDTATWCHTLMDGRGVVSLVGIDMSTGNWVEEAQWGGFDLGGLHTGGLATDGSTWVFSGRENSRNTWYAVDAASGSVTLGASAGSQVAVGWSGTEWVTVGRESGRMERFSTFADLAANTPTTSVAVGGMWTRLAVDGSDVYGAWHSADEILVHDLTTGALSRSFFLDGWDSWVWGMSVAGGKLHLIDDARQASEPGHYEIGAFDAASGDWVESVTLTDMPGRPSGLWCSTTAL